MRLKLIIASVIVVLVGVWVAANLSDALTTRVSIAAARRTEARVQVMGEILHSQVEYDAAKQLLRFPIRDRAGDVFLLLALGVLPRP